MNATTVREELVKSVRLLAVMTVVLFVLIVAVAVVGITKNHSDNVRTNNALCALRIDLERRVQTSVDLVTTHPKGVAGIPSAVLIKSIRDQRRTIMTLRHLHCG